MTIYRIMLLDIDEMKALVFIVRYVFKVNFVLTCIVGKEHFAYSCHRLVSVECRSVDISA